jgi:hypothetical protein
VGVVVYRARVEAAGRTVDSVPAFEYLIGGNCFAYRLHDHSNEKPLIADRRIPIADSDLSDQVACNDRWRVRIPSSGRRVLADGTLPSLTVDMSAAAQCGYAKGQEPDAQGPNDSSHSDQRKYIRYW